MSNNYELIENPRLTGAKMLNDSVDTASSLYLQAKQLQAQKEELQMRKDQQQVTVGLSYLSQLPDTLKVKALNKMAPKLSQMTGMEIPQFTDEDMGDPQFKTMLDGFKQIDSMKNPDGSALSDKIKLSMKRPVAAEYLNKKGKSSEAIKTLFADDEPKPVVPIINYTINPDGTATDVFSKQPITSMDPKAKYKYVEPKSTSEKGDFWKTFDKDFAKNAQDWETKNRVTNLAGVKALESVATQFDNGDMESRARAMMPGRSMTAPKLDQAIKTVEKIVFPQLRQTMGPQFTEQEGKRVINATIDPLAPPENNSARLRALKQIMDEQSAAMDSMVAYAKENGTMKGYSGPQLKFQSADDVISALGENTGGSSSGSRSGGRMTATNKKTGQKIYSNDGGKTWLPVQ